MKHKPFDRLFFKYLISYLLILLIPILFINLLFGHRFIKAYKKEIQAQAEADLMYLGQLIDTELQNISTTVDQMHISMDFDGFHFADNPLKSRSYLNHIAVYSITNPLISEIGIYLRGEDYMFLNQSTCQVAVSYTHLCEADSRKQIKQTGRCLYGFLYIPELCRFHAPATTF